MNLRRWLPLPALLGVALLALFVRVAYLMELNGSPLLSVLLGDGRQYDAWAQQIAGGQWIGTEIFYQTPLYPYWLAVIFTAAGHNLDLVRLIQAILGAASCVLLGLAGRRFFSDRVGVIAALLLAVYPPAFFFDGLIQKSSLDIFLITLALALLAEFHHRPGWKWTAALGATTAALVLNRENAVVLYPVIVAWLLFYFRHVPIRHRAAWAGVFVMASLVVLLPVGFRNYHVGGEFLLTTSQMGSNFFIGNNPHARGSYEALVPDHGDPAYERDDAARLASEAAGRVLSPGEVSDYWLRESLSYIRNQPFQWIALLGKKVFLTFNAAEIPDTESIEAYSDYSRILRALICLNFGVVFPFAVLGGWLHRRNWRRLLILHAMVASLALAVALFYVVARYRHPLVPVILLFSAAGISGLFDIRLRGSAPVGKEKPGNDERPAFRRSLQSQTPLPDWKRQWLPGILAAGLIAIAVNIPIKVVHDETYANVGALLVKDGRYADAVPLLLKAIALDHNYAAPHLALGVAFRNLNRPAEALRHLTEAVRFAPDSVETHSNLGLALIEAGRPREAILEQRRAVELSPENPYSHNYLAGALHQTGDFRQAIAEYRKALALKPDYAEAHNNLALALVSVKDYDGAYRHFRETIRLMPSNYIFRTNFGRVLGESGRIDEGIEQLEEAARLSPEFIEAPYLSAQIYARAGRFAEALASLEKALDIANATGQTDAARQINEAIRKTRPLMERRHP
ncbi:MAG: tetratricopeptide repeat protein [Deltaproteobacteria bacterium]|nr:tetratricopeptide repeat protein [Deltaproteobacteria bacterium]